MERTLLPDRVDFETQGERLPTCRPCLSPTVDVNWWGKLFDRQEEIPNMHAAVEPKLPFPRHVNSAIASTSIVGSAGSLMIQLFRLKDSVSGSGLPTANFPLVCT